MTDINTANHIVHRRSQRGTEHFLLWSCLFGCGVYLVLASEMSVLFTILKELSINPYSDFGNSLICEYFQSIFSFLGYLAYSQFGRQDTVYCLP